MLAHEMNRFGESAASIYTSRDCALSTCETKNFDEFSSGLKVFDQAYAAGPFMTGNVFSDVQMSKYVRAHGNVECNGRTWTPGELRAADLKWLKECHLDGKHVVLGWMKDPAIAAQDAILYAVFHPKSGKPGERIMHGWVLTDTDHKLLRSYVLDGSRQSEAIMRRAIDVFTDSRTNEELIFQAAGGEVVHIDERLADLLKDEVKEAFGLLATEAERPRG